MTSYNEHYQGDIDGEDDFSNYPEDAKNSYREFWHQHIQRQRDVIGHLRGQEAVDAENKLNEFVQKAFYAGYAAGILSDLTLPEEPIEGGK
ncbi:MAG TPA: hypothetical protein VFL85_04345 [Candidatus Saccharimonadales bacterium]|nr:hypothetical protein [Candidatus Saccharimonadales bacterium]